jgi:uncharacterized sulfatase
MENPTNTNNQPNIILITVDQMRFPMHLPPDTLDVDQFVEKYMPHLYLHLWKDGVKFSNFYTAASDCTAARATIHTGLYAYQTYSMLTLITYPEGPPNSPYKPPLDEPPYQPELDPDFPTIGRLMREAGYESKYFGKWHLSYDASELERYGYTSHTKPEDLIGEAGQGLETDGEVAERAATWITNYVASPDPNQKPLFFALNFVNPHDKQWFWGGMQADALNEVYSSIPPYNGTQEEPPRSYTEIPGEAEPLRRYSLDIKQAIPNWEDHDRLSKKPQTQTIIKEVFQYQMGGIYEEDMKPTYTPVKEPPDFNYAQTPLHPPTPVPPGKHKAIAPPEYWSKALDSYLQVMGYVDDAIGTFMRNIPDEVRQNAIFVFTSDHGEYASSHGLQGKGGTVYEEGIRVPLIVRDLSNGFMAQAEQKRKQLSSSVDLLPMIVSMAYGGETGWMTNDNDYQQLYGNRWDLLSILLSPAAPGRPYALHSTDEFIPEAYNYLDAPLHVIGLIQMDNGSKQKLGVYTNWAEYSPEQNQAQVLYPTPTIQAPNVEFYDGNRLENEVGEPIEVESTYNSAAAQAALGILFGGPVIEILGLIGTELQAPLPAKYQDAQRRAYHKLQNYMRFVNETSGGGPNIEAIEESEQRLARAWAL